MVVVDCYISPNYGLPVLEAYLDGLGSTLLTRPVLERFQSPLHTVGRSLGLRKRRYN